MTYFQHQFLVDGFSEPFRLNRNRNGGGIMIFVRKDKSSKLLQKHVHSVGIEGLFNELNFRKCKWLLFGTYHPPSQEDQYYYNIWIRHLIHICQYDNVLLSGDSRGLFSLISIYTRLKKSGERKNIFQKCV